jgi:hypothetical protein
MSSNDVTHTNQGRQEILTEGELSVWLTSLYLLVYNSFMSSNNVNEAKQGILTEGELSIWLTFLY